MAMTRHGADGGIWQASRQGSAQKRDRRLDGKGRLSVAHRTGVVPLTVAGSRQLVEASCVLVAGWLVDHCAKEQTDGFVLARSAECAVPVRGENGFADVVASVVGQVVPVLRLGEVRKVRDDVLGLANEDRGFGQVNWYSCEPSVGHEGIDSPLLDGRQTGHCHGGSPNTWTIGLARTCSRKPDSWRSSSRVLIVGFTGLPTSCATRRQAS